jgi:hypothetical protein
MVDFNAEIGKNMQISERQFKKILCLKKICYGWIQQNANKINKAA